MSIRRDPFEEMNRLFDQMRRSMSGMGMGPGRIESNRPVEGGDGLPVGGSDWMGGGTNLTTKATDEGYVVLADLPGFDRDEIDLRFDDGTLSIVAEHGDSVESDGSFARRRRSVRETVRVPGTVPAEAIEAVYRNGVLEITLPRDDDGGSYRIDID